MAVRRKNMTTKELMSNRSVILASASPRRKELLKLICDDFRVIPSDKEEILPDCVGVESAAEYLSAAKCKCLSEVYTSSLVIGCDTVVICDGEILGKPTDEADAVRMLTKLSGKTHKVMTGVTLGYKGVYLSFAETTEVTFRELDGEEIADYVATGEPTDKAGAYGIQGYGALLAEKIDGDFFNVVGLPVSKLSVKLKQFLEENSF
jgi:septum formation protein